MSPILSLLGLCFFPCILAGEGAWIQPTSLSAVQRAVINDFIEGVMECHNVPGLSFAVVGADDSGQWWSHSDSFGQADMLKEVDVTTETLFNIGSTTKAFTATLLAMLLEESEKYTWTTPIREILGDSFLLADEYRTNHVTLVDLLSHRVGLARHDYLWILGYITERKELLDRLYLLEIETEFRTEFLYNNLMYALAGYVAEKMGGKSWEVLVKEKIFDRLGMDSSSFIDQMGPDYEGLARVHYLVNNGSLEQSDMALFETVTPVAPAGSIVSSADDMAKWMIFQLSGGRDTNNESLVSPEGLHFTHKSQMSMPITPLLSSFAMLPVFPVSESFDTYSLGWFEGHYQGYRGSRHGGSLLGYETLISLQWHPGFGIFTTMNGPMTQICMVVEGLIHMYINDVIMDREPWLSVDTACSYPEPWQADPSSMFPGPSFGLNTTGESSRDLQDYAGDFANIVYGELTVWVNTTEGRLEVSTKSGKLDFAMYPSGQENVFFVKLLGTAAFFDMSDVYAPKAPEPIEVVFTTKGQGKKVFQLIIIGPEQVVFERDMDISKLPIPDFVDKKEKECQKNSAPSTLASPSLLHLVIGLAALTWSNASWLICIL